MERIAQALPAVRIPVLPWRPVLSLVAAVAILGAGWILGRDLSVFKINRVEIIGLSTNEGPAVERALTAAARDMTTLNLDRGALDEAVADHPSVAGLRVQTDFPRGVSIEVTERAPIAKVDLAGQVVPVGAGGRLMRGVKPERALPVLHATRLAPGGRLTDPKALAAVDVLAAAPAALRERVNRIWSSRKGLTLDMRAGPQLFFGSARRPTAKWTATARVLAEPSAAGAVYLDVRVPERVAAGGLGTAPTAPETALDNTQAHTETSPTLNP